MAARDQKKRLELLWKLTETGEREDLKKIYDTGACQCEINVPQISKQLTAQWNYTNKTPPESDTKKLFIELAKKIKNKTNIIYIGDSEIDFNFAKNSSMNFILVKNGYTSYEEKKITQKFSINNFFQLKKIINLIYFNVFYFQ